MALTASQIWEVESTGSDTLNGGGFDPLQVLTGGFTDGAATAANTSAPVFTSASYTFVAGDVGAWVYINTGTNWIPGWYQIVSVAAGAATLNGTIGQAILAMPMLRSTVVGMATVASPTGATWAIDYSQQAAAQFAYTDLASAGTGLTVSSAATPFGRQMVGNTLVITGGTNFNTGRYVIASVAAVTFIATVIGPTNITTGAGVSGTGGQGGALASPGAGSLLLTIANQQMYIKAGTYSITSASANVAGGCIAPANGAYIEGYQTYRTDTGTPPLLQASGISTFTIVTLPGTASPCGAVNLRVDGATLTSSRGFSLLNGAFYKLTAENCTNNGFNSGGATVLLACVATGCTTQPAFTTGFSSYINCVAYSNTVSGFVNTGISTYIHCLAYSNSGATSDGFSVDSDSAVVNCVAYGNGRDGFRSLDDQVQFVNCIAEANTGFGYNNATAVVGTVFYSNCAAFNNTAGATSLGTVAGTRNYSFITGTATFFTNAAGANFSLNTTAGGGAVARAAGIPGALPIGGTGFLDVGALQHADPASSGGLLTHPGMSGGMRG